MEEFELEVLEVRFIPLFSPYFMLIVFLLSHQLSIIVLRVWLKNNFFYNVLGSLLNF